MADRATVNEHIAKCVSDRDQWERERSQIVQGAAEKLAELAMADYRFQRFVRGVSGASKTGDADRAMEEVLTNVDIGVQRIKDLAEAGFVEKYYALLDELR